MDKIDKLAVTVATAGGAGFFPLFPGTIGSAIGVALYALIALSALHSFYWLILGVLSLVGIWAAGRVEGLYGHDASRIVIDEVVGQLLTLGFLAPATNGDLLGGLILGFLLFRFFDILKPFPVRRLEQLSGGLGVVADDLGAGVYALLSLLVIESLHAGLL